MHRASPWPWLREREEFVFGLVIYGRGGPRGGVLEGWEGLAAAYDFKKRSTVFVAPGFPFLPPIKKKMFLLLCFH